MAKRNQQQAPGPTEIPQAPEPALPPVSKAPETEPESPETDPEELETDPEELEQPQESCFDPAWLERLVWHGARRLPGPGNRYEAIKRKAQAFDVLAWNRSGGTVTIVLSDGSKHIVEV